VEHEEKLFNLLAADSKGKSNLASLALAMNLIKRLLLCMLIFGVSAFLTI